MLGEKDVQRAPAAREQAAAAIALLMSYYPPALAARSWLTELGPKYWTKFWIEPVVPMLRDVRTSRDAATALHVMFSSLLTDPGGEPALVPAAVTAAVKAGVVNELAKLFKAKLKVEYPHHHPLKEQAASSDFECAMECCAECSADTASVLACSKCRIEVCAACAQSFAAGQSELHLESRGLAAAALIAIHKSGATGAAAVVRSGAPALIVAFLRSAEAAALFKEEHASALPKGSVSATMHEAVASLASLAEGDKLGAAVKAAGGLPELSARASK